MQRRKRRNVTKHVLIIRFRNKLFPLTVLQSALSAKLIEGIQSAKPDQRDQLSLRKKR